MSMQYIDADRASDFAHRTYGKSDEEGNRIAANDLADLMEFLRDKWMGYDEYEEMINEFHKWQSK